MAITTADVTLKNQWDALKSAIEADVAPGKRLSTVNYVARAFQLWTPNPPTIGVQLVDAPLTPRGALQRTMTSEYWVLVGTRSTKASAESNMGAYTPANLEDAMNQLQPILADGNGNGLMAVLTDPANYSLGGWCYRMIPSSPKIFWDIQPGENAQIWAYAQITVAAEAIVSFSPPS